MAYDTFYGDLSTRGTSNEILSQVLQTKSDVALIQTQVEATAEQVNADAIVIIGSIDSAVAAADTATNAANFAQAQSSASANSAMLSAQYAQDSLTNSAAALVVANTANGKSDTAVSNSTNAQTVASGAVNTANNALSVANGIDAKATSALSTANTANDTSNNALSVANGVDAKATSALSTANAAQSAVSSKQDGSSVLTGLAAVVPAANGVSYVASLSPLTYASLTVSVQGRVLVSATTFAAACNAIGAALATDLASTTTTANNALPKTGGAISGTLSVSGLLSANGGVSTGTAGVTSSGSIIATGVSQIRGANSSASPLLQLSGPGGTTVYGTVYADPTSGVGIFTGGNTTTAALYANSAGVVSSRSNLVAGGQLQAGGGSAIIGTDGNIQGSAWASNNLVVDLSSTIATRLGTQTVAGNPGSYMMLRNRTGGAVAPGVNVSGTLNYCSGSGTEAGGTAGGTWTAMGNCPINDWCMFLRRF